MGNQYTGKNYLICGVGINDLPNTLTKQRDGGGKVKCPYYSLWTHMLSRVYTPTSNQIIPYAGVTVHSDWHRFSNFKRWVDQQPQSNWRELQLDKDMLVKGNKVYAPDVCCFLTKQENVYFRLSVSPFGHIRRRADLIKKCWVSECSYKGQSFVKYFYTQEEAKVHGAKFGIQKAIDIANANPHRFIQDAMFRWIADWQQELTVLEEAARVVQSSAGSLFEN
jgi:hypothetical protein